MSCRKLLPLVEGAESKTGAHKEEQVSIVRDGIEHALRVRVTSERSEEDVHSYVVTLDDVTDLVSAQRSAAWADVARRIAHEIKNPLTPIQLSAERLRRRYGKKVDEDDRKVFDQCVNTIVRQVGDIGRMIDEFSSFARMPKPVFEPGDLSEVIQTVSFPHRSGQSGHLIFNRYTRKDARGHLINASCRRQSPMWSRMPRKPLAVILIRCSIRQDFR